MTDFSYTSADAGAISDLDQLCDEDNDVSSSASSVSGGEEVQVDSRQGDTTPQFDDRTENPAKSLTNGAAKEDTLDTVSTERDLVVAGELQKSKCLNILDLPVDLLQEIIKEVTHTNDLTSLALTCSALHSLAIPQMYSRFDIVWPDAFPQSDHPAGVDALSYGLATLVMGEDIFREVPANLVRTGDRRNCHYHQPDLSQSTKRIRRGNYFAQFTRKFSVGNGPPDWVQEYSVTKETGKMLGTLVALAVARMVNLETFIWDMPTGVVRDVWIALASLAERPGHECRLENVWIRWHDNSENTIRSLTGVPTTSSLTLPETQNVIAPPSGGSSLFRKYGHVEYPSLSILPPLKCLSVLDIDEPSYLEETAVLIRRSRDRLRELRIGLSPKVYQLEWLKPQGTSQSEQQTATTMSGWPRAGGALGAILGWTSRRDTQSSVKQENPTKGADHTVNNSNVQEETPDPVSTVVGALSSQTLNAAPMHNLTETQDIIDAGNVPQTNSPQPTQSVESKSAREASKKVPKEIYSSTPDPNHQSLKLDVLELERVPISAAVLLDTIDWTRITTLTILRCEGHEKLWRGLRRRFAPSASTRNSPKHGRKEVAIADKNSSEYPLKIKHIHTDAVSPYLLLFIKDTLRPDTLETVFLHGSPLHDSAVHVEGIYRNVIRNHRSSLKKLLVDSTERSTAGAELGTTRWRKWMFTREIITFITSGRMPKLRELSMTIDSKDWHYFLQRLPYIPHLRALHIPHIVRLVHLDLKELAMQVLDIVTLRPEINISYLGMQSKCYEILEGNGSEYDIAETDEAPSEGFVPGPENWTGSETHDEEDSDDEEDEMIVTDTHSDVSSEDPRSLEDDDASDYDCGRPRVSFRLREILFYDDKIAIFKARHGVL